MTSENKKGLIEFLLDEGNSGSWKEIGQQFGFEAEQARKIWLNYRKKNNIEKVENEVAQVTQMNEDLETGKGEVTISDPKHEIQSLEDLEKLIDMEKWSVSKYVQNFWNGKYQVKAWLERKVTVQADLVKDIIDNWKSDWKQLKASDKLINKSWDEENLLVINLNDLHFDKRDMENNTIETNIENYFKVLDYLVGKAYHSAKLEQILFVVGNDVFNTDNVHDTTTAGTPQRCNTTWNDAYEKVFDAMVQSIAKLSKFASKVHVVLVQGNHDRAKSYYMAHALETYFKKDNTITFDRSVNINKSFVYGTTFLGFNHGNNINDKLPLAFAQEFYADWGKCKYHDILISDKHHTNEKVFKVQTQNDGWQGVKVRILPSLSKPDRWHDDNLYRSRQSGVALLYDKERGKSAEFEYQL